MTTRGPMTTRLLTACTVVLVAITATGCVRFTAPDSPPQRTTAITPTPPGMIVAKPGTALPPDSETDNCNRLASLRPIPLPEPGQMPPRTPMAEIYANGRLIVGVDTRAHIGSSAASGSVSRAAPGAASRTSTWRVKIIFVKYAIKPSR